MSRPMPASQELLFEHTGPSYTVAIRSDASRLTAYLDILPRQPKVPTPPVAELLAILEPAKVKFFPDLADRLGPALSNGLPLRGLVVATGRPPEKGPAGDLEWKVYLETGKKHHVKIVEGRADYHEVVEIAQINEGEELVRIVPPGIGPAGEDVLGREIPGLPGTPAYVEFGNHVRFDEKTSTAYAAVSGAVEFVGNRLAVVPIYTVEGDVASETGNIHFAGEVVVRGDVRDDFIVHGEKGISVSGAVHAAQLESAGDIRISLGASGRNLGSITTEGNVQAKYLNAVTVVCRGNLNVNGEILNCKIRTGGRLSILTGRIVGGDIVALRGVEARQIGSPANVPTVITVGMDVDSAQKLAQLEKRLQEAEEEMDRLHNLIRPYIEEPELVASLPKYRQQTVKPMLESFNGLRQLKETLKKEISEMEIEEVDPKDQFVKISRMIHRNVTLTIGNCTQTFTSDASGPVTFMADPETGRLVKR